MVSEPKQVISHSNVNDVVFSKRPKIFFSFDIKSLDVIEEVCLKQCIDIRLHCMSTWCTFSLPVFKQAFIHKRVTNR